MGLLEYRAMPSLRDIGHDGGLYTFTIKQQLEIPSARNCAAPVRETGTVRKRQTVWPAIMYKITPARSITSSQPSRPPWWASPLAFGLFGSKSGLIIYTISVAVSGWVFMFETVAFSLSWVLNESGKRLLNLCEHTKDRFRRWKKM